MCKWLRKIQSGNVTTTTKEDGSAVTIGINQRGEHYVSREGKVGVVAERFYDADSVPLECPGVNAALYIAAQMWCGYGHKWVFGGKPGDAWNCEVVSAGLNVIEYKHTALVLLHGVDDKATPIDNLAFARSLGQEIDVPKWHVDDNDNLCRTTECQLASIRYVANATSPNVDNIIQMLDMMTNYGTVEQVLSTNLTTVHTDVRERFKAYRDYLEGGLRDTIRALGDDDGLRHEGIVIDDGETAVKVVNPTFVVANQYQHAVRNCIRARTFSRDFSAYFPSCPQKLIDDISSGWRIIAGGSPTALTIHNQRAMLATMRDHYIRAQCCGLLRDPTGLYGGRYPQHTHNATLVAFAAAIDSLSDIQLNTGN